MKGLFVLFAVIAVVAANQCQEEDIDKLLNHEDCDKFYKCSFGEPVVQYCPAGLYFNLELEQCDWPANVDCRNRNVPSVVKFDQRAQVIAEVAANQCPQEEGTSEKLLNHEDCDKFYKCSFGEPVVQYCPAGLYFNLELEQCDWPANVDCRNRNVPSVVKFDQRAQVIAEAAANQCPQEEGTSEKLLNHEDCDKFYKCSFGEPVVQYCPAGLYFNLELEQCDWPANVDCRNRNVPSVVKFDQRAQVLAEVAANQCPQEDGTTEKLLNHEDCDKFYKCSFGEPVVQYCPAGLYFNLELEQCDWPENVDCGNRNVPVIRFEQPEPEDEDCSSDADNAEPEEIELLENGCPVDSQVPMLLPHEANCNLFYHCVDGQKVLRECANSLHFNKELQVCDWPSDAGCAVSVDKHLSGRQALRQFS